MKRQAYTVVVFYTTGKPQTVTGIVRSKITRLLRDLATSAGKFHPFDRPIFAVIYRAGVIVAVVKPVGRAAWSMSEFTRNG